MTEKAYFWWIRGSETAINDLERDPNNVRRLGEHAGLRLPGVQSVHSFTWERTMCLDERDHWWHQLHGIGVAVVLSDHDTEPANA